jgi:hypothetical protein
LLAVINTLTLSANNGGLEHEFIPRGRSLIYSMNNKDPTIDPGGTRYFNVPQLKVFAVGFAVLFQPFAFYRLDRNQSSELWLCVFNNNTIQLKKFD